LRYIFKEKSTTILESLLLKVDFGLRGIIKLGMDQTAYRKSNLEHLGQKIAFGESEKMIQKWVYASILEK